MFALSVFCNATATYTIYTHYHVLSLHDAIPILLVQVFVHLAVVGAVMDGDAVVALCDRTEVLDVFFGTGPPDAVHFVARIADGLRLAYRSEEHTYKLQSLMRSSYAVICLKKKNKRIF